MRNFEELPNRTGQEKLWKRTKRTDMESGNERSREPPEEKVGVQDGAQVGAAAET